MINKTTIVVPENWPARGQTRQDIERDVIGFIHDWAPEQGYYLATRKGFDWVSSPQIVPEKIRLISVDHGIWTGVKTPIDKVKWRGIKSRSAVIVWEQVA